MARCVTSCHYGALEHLAGIHDAVWVEGALEFAHQLQFERRLVALDFLALQLPQAVLRADRAPETRHAVVHQAIDRRRILDKNIGGNPFGSGYVVVKVSVAEMSESHHARARMSACEFLVRRGNELGNARDRNRYVVLDIRAFMGLRFGDKFTQFPESPGLSFAL